MAPSELPKEKPLPGVDAFIGRQPIFDRQMKMVANELLFRNSEDNRAIFDDGNVAASTTIIGAFLEFGIESLVGDGRAYLNLPAELLRSDHLFALPKEKVVLEILEDVAPEPDLVARVQALKEAGYTIALDDFIYRPELTPLIELADIIKVEVMDKAVMHMNLAALKDFPGQLLAEKVEDQQDMTLCESLGFQLFQGYFLCRPVVVKGRRMPQSKLGTLRLLAQLSDPNVNISQLETVVSADVALSFRLLRYLNSAHFALPRQIDDIRQALTLLGLSKLRAWVSMIAIANVDDKPEELIRIALVRARLCELLAPSLAPKAAGAFTVGLFSVLDALLDQNMTTILGKLPLSPELNQALLKQEGPLGGLLEAVLALETGNWDALTKLPLSATDFSHRYVAAHQWAKEALLGMA